MPKPVGMSPYLLVLTAVLGFSCGRKEPPPSPDRWPPKLVSARAPDNLHVTCCFSEAVERESAELRENYRVAGLSDSLEVIAAALDPGGVEVALVTSPQKDVDYSISIEGVRDLSGNVIPSGTEETFGGSLLPDTIPSRVVSTYPKELDTRVPTDTSLVLGFSEPMDTTTVSPILLSFEGKLSATWNSSMTRVTLSPGATGKDTLRDDCVYNLFLSTAARDLGGNRLKSMSRITFSTGESIPRCSISGSVSLKEGEPKGTTVLLLRGAIWEKSSPFSLDQVEDTTGSYSFRYLPEGSYFILGAKSVGSSRFLGGYGVEPTHPLPISLELPPDTTVEEVDFVLYPENEETRNIGKRFEQTLGNLLDQ